MAISLVDPRLALTSGPAVGVMLAVGSSRICSNARSTCLSVREIAGSSESESEVALVNESSYSEELSEVWIRIE